MPNEMKIILKMIVIICKKRYADISDKKLENVIGLFMINNFF